ncbi:MAG TPA: transglycosylase SLT domain-containing protein [Anaerolineae bacterium]|nr:transglycosylase SLT domain-containing protein [Anaerolineae bacterium]
MKPQRAIFPAFTAGVLFLIIFTKLISSPNIVWAAGQKEKPEQPPASMTSDSLTLSGLFPAEIQQWRNEIQTAAHMYSLDPNLIAAVMLQESNGNPRAYSSSGAVGLMQVMPRDGIAANFNCGNHPCFQNRPSMTELFDPHFNIDYGSRMLTGLINKSNDTREALKAYGPMDMGYHYADIVLNLLQKNKKPNLIKNPN